MITKICPRLNAERAKTIQALFDAVCAKYGIVSKSDQAGFASQICHESGEFSIKTENMNFKTPQVLVGTWPSRFNLDGSDNKKNANDYIRNPEKLANLVYAGPHRMGNGDTASGDGFRFRGSGFMQMTGREDFEKYAKHIDKTLEETSMLVQTSDEFAMDSAAWEYVIKFKLLGETDIVKISVKVNGGKIGLEERKRYYALAMA
jgi:putative chitinase